MGAGAEAGVWIMHGVLYCRLGGFKSCSAVVLLLHLGYAIVPCSPPQTGIFSVACTVISREARVVLLTHPSCISANSISTFVLFFFYMILLL